MSPPWGVSEGVRSGVSLVEEPRSSPVRSRIRQWGLERLIWKALWA